MSFRLFLESEEDKNLSDLKATLKRLPKQDAALVKGWKYVFQVGNTMKGDKGHVGLMDPNKKTITLAAPWNYGREFTFLHEVGHLKWETLSNSIQKKWKETVKKHKDRQKDTDEELFCMAYANHYCKNRVIVHDNPAWHDFIEKLP